MDFKAIAAQLRQPHGELGKTVGERMNHSNALMNQYAIAALAVAPGDIVLEVGMGNGIFCKDVLWHESIRYVGYDFSELMVAEATRLNQALVETQQARFVLGDAAQMPFPADHFHKIFTVNTIYFWENPLQVLAEFYRVAKPGGHLVVALRTQESMAQLPFVQYGFKTYAPEAVTALLQQTGWYHISITRQEEPEEEFNGQTIQMVSLIVRAEKG